MYGLYKFGQCLGASRVQIQVQVLLKDIIYFEEIILKSFFQEASEIKENLKEDIPVGFQCKILRKVHGAILRG